VAASPWHGGVSLTALMEAQNSDGDKTWRLIIQRVMTIISLAAAYDVGVAAASCAADSISSIAANRAAQRRVFSAQTWRGERGGRRKRERHRKPSRALAKNQRDVAYRRHGKGAAAKAIGTAAAATRAKPSLMA